MPKLTNIIERYQTAQPVLLVRVYLPMEELPDLFEEYSARVSSYVKQFGEELTDVPFVIYYDYLSMDMEQVDIEICYPVSRSLPSKNEIISKIIPPSKIIFSMHKGSYTDTSPLYGEMTTWIMEKGYEPQGPSYEYYFNGFTYPGYDQLIKVVIPFKEG
ncbi:MAG: GyrI-like domain-containing protein [Tannerellaceae bacterium]|nr:GyrI-like domain-containing protein [Tannerellaceae bacterium]